MLGKWWTGAFCRYFESSVLPLDPALEAALMGGGADLRRCAACGEVYRASDERRRYCSTLCAGIAQRKQQREHMRKKRG